MGEISFCYYTVKVLDSDVIHYTIFMLGHPIFGAIILPNAIT